MRRDRRRHADGDAGRPVHEEVREAGGKDDRLEVDAVVVRLPVDGPLPDLGEELDREGPEARLGVAVRRGGVAVERAEVPVPLDERGPEREGLRHPDHGVVDRHVAVRVVLADDVADDRGRLLELGVGRQVEVLEHREEDPPLDRLQAVADVGKGPGRDDREGVVQVAPPGLLREGDLGVEGQRRLVGALGTFPRHGLLKRNPPGSGAGGTDVTGNRGPRGAARLSGPTSPPCSAG